MSLIVRCRVVSDTDFDPEVDPSPMRLDYHSDNPDNPDHPEHPEHELQDVIVIQTSSREELPEAQRAPEAPRRDNYRTILVVVVTAGMLAIGLIMICVCIVLASYGVIRL
jgi:hypothetical protein